MTLQVEKTAFDNWRGRISLGFENRNQQTFLTERQHQGPLLVQRPFYPEGPVCHVYLIHPPGGVVGGDQLEIIVDCKHNTEVLLTTPAAGKFYRSSGKTASQSVQLTVAEDAMLEWLPQETILFDGANVNSTTRIKLTHQSRFIGWEIVGLGRPVCDEAFDNGSALINIELYLENQPLLLERVILNAKIIKAMCGMAQHSMMASLLVYPATKDDLEKARICAGDQRFFGATLVNDVLICRMLGAQAQPIRKLFTSIWQALRPGHNQRQACNPRIWAT